MKQWRCWKSDAMVSGTGRALQWCWSAGGGGACGAAHGCCLPGPQPGITYSLRLLAACMLHGAPAKPTPCLLVTDVSSMHFRKHAFQAPCLLVGCMPYDASVKTTSCLLVTDHIKHLFWTKVFTDARTDWSHIGILIAEVDAMCTRQVR